MAKINIPIPKAGVGMTYEVDPDTINDEAFPVEVYLEIMLQGCKTLLNRGQSKLKSSKGLEGAAKESAVKEIMAKVEEQWQAMLKGETRITGGKAKLKGVEREVKAEAMRLARLAVRDAIKASGGKISHYKAKQITEAAEEVLATEDRGPQFMEIAKANVAKRHEGEKPASEDEKKAAATSLIKMIGLEADPEQVAKAEKASAKKKAKADKVPSEVAAKAKPKAEQHAAH